MKKLILTLILFLTVGTFLFAECKNFSSNKSESQIIKNCCQNCCCCNCAEKK